MINIKNQLLLRNMENKVTLDPKTEFIVQVAQKRSDIGSPITGTELVILLNKAGHKSSYNLPYKENTRGIYKVLDSTYRKLHLNKRKSDATMVANAFVNTKGDCAWWNKPVI